MVEGRGSIFHQDRDCDFLGSQHLVIIRGAQQEALDFMVIVGNAKNSEFVILIPVSNFSLSLSVVFPF